MFYKYLTKSQKKGLIDFSYQTPYIINVGEKNSGLTSFNTLLFIRNMKPNSNNIMLLKTYSNLLIISNILNLHCEVNFKFVKDRPFNYFKFENGAKLIIGLLNVKFDVYYKGQEFNSVFIDKLPEDLHMLSSYEIINNFKTTLRTESSYIVVNQRYYPNIQILGSSNMQVNWFFKKDNKFIGDIK